MKSAFQKAVGIFAIGALLVATAACGEDDTGPEPFVQPDTSTPDLGSDDVGDDGDTDDAGLDAETDMSTPDGERCADVECESGLKCVRGDCVPLDSKLACEEVVDLGVLEPASPQTVSGDTSDFVDTLDGSCVTVVDQFSGPENAFHFTVSTTSLVEVALTSSAANVDWALSLRSGTCASGDEVACTGTENLQFVASEGTDYYVLVEPETGIDKGAFELEFTASERDCSSPGERSCNGGDLEICGREGLLECASGCENAACTGNSCANPIEVTASMTLNGAAAAYTSDFDFGSTPSCGTSPGNGIPTRGQDLVISVPGLTMGQMLVVDASMNNDLDHAIFVLPSCDPGAECLAAIDLGDKLEYEVESDGDFFVVIDKLSSSVGDFEITLDIE